MGKISKLLRWVNASMNEEENEALRLLYIIIQSAEFQSQAANHSHVLGKIMRSSKIVCCPCVFAPCWLMTGCQFSGVNNGFSAIQLEIRTMFLAVWQITPARIVPGWLSISFKGRHCFPTLRSQGAWNALHLQSSHVFPPFFLSLGRFDCMSFE